MSTSIAEAFKKLNVAPGEEISDHEKIFTVSYEYLSKVKNFNDAKALKNCLTSLINLDKYAKALEIVNKIPTSSDITGSVVLEISYIYYKLGRSDDLIKLYNSSSDYSEGVQVGLKHMVAQNYYKSGEYTKALEIYHDLIENNKFDNKLDLVVNERSVISQLNFTHQQTITSKYSIEEHGENYDLLFNEALIQISIKNLPQALELLKRAQEICSDQNKDFAQSYVLSELLPIQLTEAYVHFLQGKTETSLELFNNVEPELIGDSILKLIIKNNKYVFQDANTKIDFNLIERDLNFQEALHKFGQKLTKLQYQTIKKNSLLLRYSTDTLSQGQVRNAFLNNFKEDFPGDYMPIAYKVLLKTGISYDNFQDKATYKYSIRKLWKYVNSVREERGEEYRVALLLLIHFSHEDKSYLIKAKHEIKSCIKHDIESSSKLSPSLVGVLDILEQETKEKDLNNKSNNSHYHKRSNYNSIDQTLQEAYQYLYSTDKQVFVEDPAYFEFAKSRALKLYDPLNGNETVLEWLNYLNSIRPDTLISAVLNNSDKDLIPIETLVSRETVDELLESRLSSTFTSQVNKPKTTVKKTKVKRIPKFSQGKVLKPEGEFELDPERWLPMKLRSYYKPTKKEKKKIGGGHQGSLGIGGNSPVPTPAPIAATSGAEKKRKKKGRK